MLVQRAVPFAALLVLAACGGTDAAPLGVTVTADSTADTVTVTVRGEPGPDQRATLVAEMRLAPGPDDTTLFTSIRELDVDQAGRLWVFDGDANAILVFSPDGELERRIGREGGGPGEFRQNGGMVVLPSGEVAQWDSRNARVSRFAPDGALLGAFSVPAGFNTSNGLYTDRDGTLYLRRPVTPPREGEILGRMGLVRLGPDGAFTDSLVPPDLDVPREVYVAEQEGGRSSMSSRYAPNYAWAWRPEGSFVVGHGGRHELIVERQGARPLVIRRESEAIPVPAEELAQEEASIRWAMRQTEPGWSWHGPPLPTTKAPLVGLTVDRSGRIWAQVAAPSEPIPEAELPVVRDTTRPIVRFRMPVVYELFSPDGDYLGQVALPPRTRLVEADGEQLWAVVLDENDIPGIARFRIAFSGGARQGP